MKRVVIPAIVLLAVPGMVFAASPTSNKASNINPSDTASAIAPQLPTPAAGEDNGPMQYLIAARRALVAGRTGEAQEALERAETRLLDRSTPLFRTGAPSRNPAVGDVTNARQALAAGDRGTALRLTTEAMRLLQQR